MGVLKEIWLYFKSILYLFHMTESILFSLYKNTSDITDIFFSLFFVYSHLLLLEKQVKKIPSLKPKMWHTYAHCHISTDLIFFFLVENVMRFPRAFTVGSHRLALLPRISWPGAVTWGWWQSFIEREPCQKGPAAHEAAPLRCLAMSWYFRGARSISSISPGASASFTRDARRGKLCRQDTCISTHVHKNTHTSHSSIASH